MKAYFVKFVKIITIVLMLTYLIFPHYSKALSLSEIIAGGEQFLQKGESNQDELFNADKEQEAVDQIYYILLGIAIIAAFVVGAILGIQFITSGAAGQAKVKEKLIPFVVGLFVVFGAFGIWKIALNLGNSLLETPPMQLSETDAVTITMSSSDSSDRKRKIVYDGTGGEVSGEDTREIQTVGIYVVNADNSNLKVASGQIKFNVSGNITKSTDWLVVNGVELLDPIVSNSETQENSNIYIDRNTVTGQNGYTTVFNSNTNEIVFMYSDLENVPNLETGKPLVTFEIAIEENLELPNEYITNKEETINIGKGNYEVSIESMSFFDKDGNDITKYISCKDQKYEFKINYNFNTIKNFDLIKSGWEMYGGEWSEGTAQSLDGATKSIKDRE